MVDCIAPPQARITVAPAGHHVALTIASLRPAICTLSPIQAKTLARDLLDVARTFFDLVTCGKSISRWCNAKSWHFTKKIILNCEPIIRMVFRWWIAVSDAFNRVERAGDFSICGHQSSVFEHSALLQNRSILAAYAISIPTNDLIRLHRLNRLPPFKIIAHLKEQVTSADWKFSFFALSEDPEGGIYSKCHERSDSNANANRARPNLIAKYSHSSTSSFFWGARMNAVTYATLLPESLNFRKGPKTGQAVKLTLDLKKSVMADLASAIWRAS